MNWVYTEQVPAQTIPASTRLRTITPKDVYGDAWEKYSGNGTREFRPAKCGDRYVSKIQPGKVLTAFGDFPDSEPSFVIPSEPPKPVETKKKSRWVVEVEGDTTGFAGCSVSLVAGQRVIFLQRLPD